MVTAYLIQGLLRNVSSQFSRVISAVSLVIAVVFTNALYSVAFWLPLNRRLALELEATRMVMYRYHTPLAIRG